MWEWFIYSLDNYQDFEGRARRMEYWSFVGGQFVVTIMALSIAGLLTMFTGAIFFPFLLVGFASLVLFVPGLAVTIRRLHDLDKSGWFLLLTFIPFGSLILLFFMLQEGTRGENRYGPDPKEELELDDEYAMELEYDDIWDDYTNDDSYRSY